jgi:hypothetical protein
MLLVKRALLPWLLSAVVASGLPAGTVIVLKDGRVLEDVEVRRDGDVYVVELASGGSLTLPVDVVAEVSLTDDKPAGEAAPGLVYAEPEQLAGLTVLPVTPAVAQAVFGEPSEFRPSIIDPTWYPESAFPERDVLAGSRSTWRLGVVDPNWEPSSGFSDGDVLAGSRSAWRPSLIDPTWVPEDGFRKKAAWWGPKDDDARQPEQQRLTRARELAPGRSGTRPEPTPTPSPDLARAHTLAPRRTPTPTEEGEQPWYAGFNPTRTRAGVQFRFLTPTGARPTKTAIRTCAQHVLDPAPSTDRARSIAVEAVDDARYASLPIDLYAAEEATAGRPSRAVFTLAGGTCRAIGGDLRDPHGVELSRWYTMAQGVEAYDAALGEVGGARLTTVEDKIDYAFAVIALIDPEVSGRRATSLVLLEDAGLLEALAAPEPDTCYRAEAKRRKAARHALLAFAPPRVVSEKGREKVKLWTWSASDGEVVAHTAILQEDGTVSLARKVVVSHVGAHRDRDRD